jgi:hypothetical protein
MLTNLKKILIIEIQGKVFDIFVSFPSFFELNTNTHTHTHTSHFTLQIYIILFFCNIILFKIYVICIKTPFVIISIIEPEFTKTN